MNGALLKGNDLFPKPPEAWKGRSTRHADRTHHRHS
jgi:hypothetical protein